MKNVKIYDVKAFIEKVTNGERTTMPDDDELAITKGPKGVVITCYEGVTWRYRGGKMLEIDTAVPGGSKLDMGYLGCYSVTYDALIANCKVKAEMPLGKFIRMFGSRLENNYFAALASLDDVGLDSKEYHEEGVRDASCVRRQKG